MLDKTLFPKISIVTATYNRADFLEKTILSLINQNYPNLEYIVIDGGSTDTTLDIIEKYQDNISYWVSEKDNGMYDAIQKGFEQSTGDIMGWLNSDDEYFEWTFAILAKIFNRFDEVEWVTTNQLASIDEQSSPIIFSQKEGYSQAGYLRGEHLPSPNRKFKMSYIMQESTFWRRSLWDKAGSTLDTSLRYAGDADLWFRFFKDAILYDVSLPLAKFRVHGNQITGTSRQEYNTEVELLLQKYEDKEFNWLTAHLRGFFKQYTPLKLRRLAYYLGFMHKSYQLRYDPYEKDWHIRQNYY